MSARVPFVIFFLERSGSSHLCSLLDSHPQISCGAEEFTTQRQEGVSPHDAPRYIHSRSSRLSAPSNEQTIQHLHDIFNRSEHAAGFKFKYPIQFNRYPEILNFMVELGDSLRVIHLDRENILKKYISKQVLVHQRQQDDNFRRTDATNFQPITIDMTDVLETLNRFELQRHQLTELVGAFQRRLFVEYERFNQEPELLETELKQYLDVDLEFRLVSKLVKRTPMTIRDAVENFDELAELLRNTKFEHLLETC